MNERLRKNELRARAPRRTWAQHIFSDCQSSPHSDQSDCLGSLKLSRTFPDFISKPHAGATFGGNERNASRLAARWYKSAQRRLAHGNPYGHGSYAGASHTATARRVHSAAEKSVRLSACGSIRQSRAGAFSFEAGGDSEDASPRVQATGRNGDESDA